jgi:hypothetical protein
MANLKRGPVQGQAEISDVNPKIQNGKSISKVGSGLHRGSARE